MLQRRDGKILLAHQRPEDFTLSVETYGILSSAYVRHDLLFET